MKNKYQKLGFTLVETIVTCIIVSAMLSLSLVFYYDHMERNIAQEGERILFAVLEAQKNYLIENNRFQVSGGLITAMPAEETISGQDIGNLDVEFPSPSNYFNPPDGTVPSSGTAYAGMVARNDHGANTYTLYIDWNGQIACTGTKCSKLKYPLANFGAAQEETQQQLD